MVARQHASWVIINLSDEASSCHYSDVTIKSPASRLFAQPFVQARIKESIKAPRHWRRWPVDSPHKLSTSIGQCYYWLWLCNHIHTSDARGQGISKHGIDRLTQFAWTIYCGAGMGLVESKSIEMVLWKYGQNCTVTLKKTTIGAVWAIFVR